MIYTFYYRNYLKYCNYKCSYCPFPKEVPSEKMIERDKKYLNKFVNYIENSTEEFNVFFAPKGEALIYDYYKEALIYLSNLRNIREVVMQTNLSSDLTWIDNANKDKLILWASYHPKEVRLNAFLKSVEKLLSLNIRFTIGTVGVKENFNEIKEISDRLKEFGKSKPYLWINAYKDEENYYNFEDIKFLSECDPLFKINLEEYKSRGDACKTGESVFFLDWNGNLHRCFKDKVKIANLYTEDLTLISKKGKCEKDICGCFIGYSNIKSLKLEQIYKNSLLGRMI